MLKSKTNNYFYDPNRDQTADLLKGLAVLFMIQVHIMELFSLPEIFNSKIGKVSLFFGGPPAAPLFMAVMGFYFAKSKKSLYQNFKRGTFLFAGGILLNIGLNFHLLIKIYSGQYNLNPYHYIFGADILTLAGLSIIILAVLKKIFDNKFYFYFAAALLAGIANAYLPNIYSNINEPAAYVQSFLWGKVEWSYFPLFPWFAYSASGAAFYFLKKKYGDKIFSEVIVNSVLAVGFLFLMGTYSYAVNISHNLFQYYNHNFLFVLWIIVFLLWFTSVVDKLETFAGKNVFILFTKWAGKNVTAFYIVQWLIIGNIATLVFRSFNLYYSIISVAMITVVVSVLVMLWIKIFRSDTPNRQ